MVYNKADHFQILSIDNSSGRNKKIGKFYCVLDNEYYPSLFHLRNVIVASEYKTVKSYYDKFYKLENEGLCVICGSQTSFRNILDGYKKYCSDTCFNRSPIKREIISNRFKNNDEKRDNAIKKAKITNNNKSSEEKRIIATNRVKTTKERFGDDYFSEKAKAQWQRRTPEQIKELSDKSNKTKLENGTMEWNFYAKCNKRIVINEIEYFCQGYEDAVLKCLINDIKIIPKIGKEIPRVTCASNKSGFFRADMLLSDNFLLEIKSDYTFSVDVENNIEKQKSAIKTGYTHLFFIIKNLTKDRELFENDKIALQNIINMSISSQAHFNEKVQRLSRDWEYRAIAFGSGSARTPEKVCDIVCSV